MLEKDIQRYERNAARILSAIDRGRVPVDWADIDEQELIRIDREAAEK